MASDDKIKDEKLQFDINKEAAEILALSYGKIDKTEYLKGEEILASDQRRLIEHLGKVLEKQRKTIEDQGKKQIKAIEDHGKHFGVLMNLLKRTLKSAKIVYYMKNKKSN